jgi:hypothetical protein
MANSEKVRLIKIPTHADERGNLSVIELKDFVDWVPRRVYYVTGTKLARGGHSVIGERKIYVCMQGTIKARFHDGLRWFDFELTGPSDAIIMDGLCWRDFTDFSEGAVLCAISNMNYEKDKYIFDFEKFLQAVNPK